jgi:hypothetical protein
MLVIFLSSSSFQFNIKPCLPRPESFSDEKVAGKKSTKRFVNLFLFADSQPLNYLTVSRHILRLEVIKKMPPLANQFQQTPAGMVVLHMRLKMFR